jgi:hypothetical protein
MPLCSQAEVHSPLGGSSGCGCQTTLFLASAISLLISVSWFLISDSLARSFSILSTFRIHWRTVSAS